MPDPGHVCEEGEEHHREGRAECQGRQVDGAVGMVLKQRQIDKRVACNTGPCDERRQ